MIELEEEEKKEEEKSFIERGGIAGYLNRNYQDKTIGKEITPAVQGTLGLLGSAVSDTMYKARRGMLGPHSFLFAHAVDFAGKIIPDAPIDRGISHGLHNWAGIDRPLADLGGELGEAYLTRKAFKFISNPKNLGITTSIEPYTKGLPSSKVKPIVNQNLTNKVTPNVTGVTNKATLPKYSSGAVVQTSEGTFYRPTEQLASIFQMDADASLLKDVVAPVVDDFYTIPDQIRALDKSKITAKVDEAKRIADLRSSGTLKQKSPTPLRTSTDAEKYYGLKSPELKKQYNLRFHQRGESGKGDFDLKSLLLQQIETEKRKLSIRNVTESDEINKLGKEKWDMINKKLGMEAHHIVPIHVSNKLKELYLYTATGKKRPTGKKEWLARVKRDAEIGIYHGNHRRNIVAVRGSTKEPLTTAGRTSKIYHRKGQPEFENKGYHAIEKSIKWDTSVPDQIDLSPYRDIMSQQQGLMKKADKAWYDLIDKPRDQPYEWGN